jgi:hypothetical protein
VEPHLIPIVSFQHRGSAGQPTHHRSGTGWRGGFVLTFLEHLLKLDMRKWLRILCDFHLMPSMFGTDFSSLFLQVRNFPQVYFIFILYNILFCFVQILFLNKFGYCVMTSGYDGHMCDRTSIPDFRLAEATERSF